MRIRLRPDAGPELELDLSSPIDLSRPLEFAATAPQPFGAPAPLATPLRVGGFLGDVAHGGSCNCSVISLTPHTSATHTECVGHLTRERLDAWRIAPRGLVPAVALQVAPVALVAPAAGLEQDRVISAAALEAAWPALPPWAAEDQAFAPRGAVIRSLADPPRPNPDGPPSLARQSAYLTAEAVHMLLSRGIEHLVVDLPSLDRMEDGGALVAHRMFFGLDAGARSLAGARRAHCTITELALIPPDLRPGFYLLSIEVPAIAGDAVPSRPLLYAVTAAAAGSS